MKVPLSKPCVTQEMRDAVQRVLDGTRFISGENMRCFEEEFAKFVGTKYAVATSSGTTALHLAMRMLRSRWEEIIVPSHTFISTVNCFLYEGINPWFVDIDEDTYNIDTTMFEEVVQIRKVQGIIPVHLYGQPANMVDILDFAERNNLFVVEDACQALGAQMFGSRVGSLSHIGCFSLYPSKVCTVLGDGGMVTTDGYAFYSAMKELREYGSSEKYVHKRLGYNYRMSEISAAIGREQLKLLPEWILRRREIAKMYGEELEGVGDLVLPKEQPWAIHVYYMYVVRTKQRDKLQKFLGDNGVETGIHYPIPIHKQPFIQQMGYGNVKLPVTEKICQEILSIPMYPQLSDGEVVFVAKKIKEFYGE